MMEKCESRWESAEVAWHRDTAWHHDLAPHKCKHHGKEQSHRVGRVTTWWHQDEEEEREKKWSKSVLSSRSFNSSSRKWGWNSLLDHRATRESGGAGMKQPSSGERCWCLMRSRCQKLHVGRRAECQGAGTSPQGWEIPGKAQERIDGTCEMFLLAMHFSQVNYFVTGSWNKEKFIW